MFCPFTIPVTVTRVLELAEMQAAIEAAVSQGGVNLSAIQTTNGTACTIGDTVAYTATARVEQANVPAVVAIIDSYANGGGGK